MIFKTPLVSYRELKLSNICSEKYRHLLLLLYWPVYMVIFSFLEKEYWKYMSSIGKEFHVMYSPIDDLIPFNELFLIPYIFWFLYIVLVLAYTLFYDVDTFKGVMTFIIITYTIALVSYFIYPTIQNLRPQEFERDNALTTFMGLFYKYDTNTNVCPSVHVLGSIASTIGFVKAKGLCKAIKISCHIMNILICLSTLFLKQHSIIDVLVALPICFIAYFISFKFEGKPRKKQKEFAV